MATLLSILSNILWMLLCGVIGVYLLNFVLVGEALATWNIYTWIAHGIVVSIWAGVAHIIGLSARKLRTRHI